MTEHTLTPEEEAIGLRLVRSCDAYALMRWALEEAVARGAIADNDEDLENARAELLMRKEEADNMLRLFKEKRGITE